MYTTYGHNDILASSGQEMSGKGNLTPIENGFNYTGGSYYEGNSNSARISDYEKGNHGGVNNFHKIYFRSYYGAILPDAFTRKERKGSTVPLELFSPAIVQSRWPRYVHLHDHATRLVFSDGACLYNGRLNAHAGWGVVAAPPTYGSLAKNKCGRLESRSKSGHWYPQTSNRAELRGLLAALSEWDWEDEACATLVIAIDSEYVHNGATAWIKQWLRNGWRTSQGQPVMNQDLWEEILHKVGELAHKGTRLCLWKIKREYNDLADALAKEGAKKEPIE